MSRRDCFVCGGAGYRSTEPSPNACASCGGTGTVEAAPDLGPTGPQTRLVPSPARYADGTPYWWTREVVR